ncbi:MAG: restriction endonuclease [Paracoccaceae bacterium]|jgi:hypothetical protein
MATLPGKGFEEFVAEVYKLLADENPEQNLHRDIKLQSPDGPRQIDILLEGSVFGHKTLCIVECKDLGRPVSVEHIDKLDSLYRDVGAHMAILVSRTGFSKTAIQKARRKSIELLVMNDKDDVKRNMKLRRPIVVEERFLARHNISGKFMVHVEGLDLKSIFRMLITGLANIKVSGIEVPLTEHFTEVALANFHETDLVEFITGSEMVIFDETGTRIASFLDFNYRAGIGSRFWYSHLHDFPPFCLKHQTSTGETIILYRMEDLVEHSPNLQAASTKEEIPFPDGSWIKLDVITVNEETVFQELLRNFESFKYV